MELLILQPLFQRVISFDEIFQLAVSIPDGVDLIKMTKEKRKDRLKMTNELRDKTNDAQGGEGCTQGLLKISQPYWPVSVTDIPHLALTLSLGSMFITLNFKGSKGTALPYCLNSPPPTYVLMVNVFCNNFVWYTHNKRKKPIWISKMSLVVWYWRTYLLRLRLYIVL